MFVGFNGVEAGFLQAVGLELVDQSDAAALLPQVDHNAFPLGLDHAQR